MTDRSMQVSIQAMQELLRIEVGGAYISKVRRERQDPDMARNVTALVAGVTRMRRYLDFLLSAHFHGNLKKMEPPLKQILRLAVFECYLSDKPHHAVVYRAVQMAREQVRPGAAKLTNAIMRAMQRAPLPVPATGDAADDLAILFSHPTWMVRRWLTQFGNTTTKALLAHNNQRPWYGIRCNTRVSTPDALHVALNELSIRWEPSALMNDFVRTRQIGALQRTTLLDGGHCTVQDEGAGLVVRLLDPQPGERVIDVCAAPGGKATYAASRMQNQGTLLAIDAHAARLRRVEAAAQAQQLSVIHTRSGDARTLDMKPAHRVLVDAPCTGTGVLAKRADLRWRRTAHDLGTLMALQDELLDAAAKAVRPQGVLVYSTCSIEPEENEQRIERFLKRHTSFVLERADSFVPKTVTTKDGYLRTNPWHHKVDGTFAARMRRT